MNSQEKQQHHVNIKERLINPLLVVAVLLLLIPLLTYSVIKEIIFRIQFQNFSRRTKKRVILVTSDSPIWGSYIKENILPLFGESVLVLNWSQRKEWDQTRWEVKVFHYWGGLRDFNPLVIINKNLFQVTEIRLYDAFKDFKHGNHDLLHEKEKIIRKAVKSINIKP